MSDQMPAGVSIEDVYVIEATYTPEAGERLPAVRGTHLGRFAELRAAGTLIEAGAYKDMSGWRPRCRPTDT